MTETAPARGLAEAITAADRGRGLAETMAAVLTRHGDRPALGERARDRATGRLLPRFDTISYRELWGRVRAVASAWHDPDYPLRPGDRMCFLGFTSTGYATLDLACIHAGVVPVPLQSGAPPPRLAPIIEETEPRVLACGAENLDTAVELVLGAASIRRLVVFGHHAHTLEAARRRFTGAGRPIVVESLDALIERGRSLPPAPLFTADRGDDLLALLLYTSGSTGEPKGAMYPQRLVGTAWYGFTYGSTEGVPVVVHYMPMSHLAGRYSLMTTLANGGVGHFTAESDLSTLFEDIALVRPTELTWVPRVVDMLHQRYRSELGRRAGEPGDVDAAVKADLRENFLGGRVTKVFVGTAPLSAGLAEFLESCLGVRVHTGLGSTEAGGVLLDSVVQRPPVIDYKLVDVPELGYFRTDKPHPRGELLLKTSTAIPGYYRRPELTAAVFDRDGYYRTGDVMAEIGPDRLVHVDRVTDTLKLSQGEFVAVSRLEAVFAGSPLVRQVYLYGNSERAYLLAVVVPTPEALAGTDFRSLGREILSSLQRVAHRAGLAAYEVPRDVLVEPEPFSARNGLLAESHKPLRPRLKERYGPALERLYAERADQRDARLRELRRAGPRLPRSEVIHRAVRAVLGGADADLRPDVRFTDLGGDSLSALAFSTLVREVCDVELPVGVIVSPANDLAALARYVEAGVQRPTSASVHGADRTEVRAADLALEKFVDPGTLAAARSLPLRTARCGPS